MIEGNHFLKSSQMHEEGSAAAKVKELKEAISINERTHAKIKADLEKKNEERAQLLAGYDFSTGESHEMEEDIKHLQERLRKNEEKKSVIEDELLDAISLARKEQLN